MNTKSLWTVMILSGMPLALMAEDTGQKPASVEVSESIEAAAGLSPKEAAVLKQHYRWKQSEGVPADYTLEELYKVMDDSADNTLELEDYDWQARKLVIALMVVGDQRFAKEMDGRAVPIQKEMVIMLQPLWEKYGLRYPLVEEMSVAARSAP